MQIKSNDNTLNAFTLAEILITLAVIGIVAALTIPNLVQKYKRLVVENKLKKFYVNINQAVQMAEIDYGDKKNWYKDVQGYEITDEDGNPIPGIPEKEKWFRKYLAPYLKYEKIEFKNNTITVYFNDGSIMQSGISTTRDWYFYTMDVDKCSKLQNNQGKLYGACRFVFNFVPDRKDSRYFYCIYNKGMEPSNYQCITDDEQLKEGCYNNTLLTDDNTVEGSVYCTALIQKNNWNIPDDYPLKF